MEMRKEYKDLIFFIFCAYFAIKYTVFFIIVVAAILAIWFLLISDETKKEIKDKISIFRNR